MSDTATNRNGWLAAAVLGCVGLAFVLSACVNVNVDADSYARKYLAVADRAMAIQIAKERAGEDGARVEDYRTNAAEHDRDGAYWVTFDLIVSRPAKGWPAHFAVRVAADGTTEVYKNK